MPAIVTNGLPRGHALFGPSPSCRRIARPEYSCGPTGSSRPIPALRRARLVGNLAAQLLSHRGVLYSDAAHFIYVVIHDFKAKVHVERLRGATHF